MNRSAKKTEGREELDEMKPEYDFSAGEQGKHAHLFGEVSEDEALVGSFWRDKEMEAAKPGELVGGLRQDPIYNRISNAVHTAVKQLESINPDHDVFNILVLVNHDKAAKYADLVSVLTGYWDPLQGIIEKTHTQFSEGRIQAEKRKIDLYVWLKTASGGQLQLGYFFGNNQSVDSVSHLLNIDRSKVRMIS